MPEVSLEQWNRFLQNRPNAHFLQTGEWGELKASFGWEPLRLIAGDSGAQVLLRRLPLGLTIGYVPRLDAGGPRAGMDDLLLELDQVCQSRRAILCKIEPDEWTSGDIPSTTTRASRKGDVPVQHPSPHNIQPRSTIIID